MAKKVTPAPMTQTAEGELGMLSVPVQIQGIAFRWINGDVRNQMGTWGHWRVVEKDSELGEKLKDHMDSGHSKYIGGNEDSNYFRRGQLVLAWAPQEAVDAHRQMLKTKAEERMRSVVKQGSRLYVANIDPQGNDK